MKKWLLPFLVATLVLSSIISSPQVYADSLDDMKKEKNNLEQKKTELNTGIQKKSGEINENQSKISSIQGQINKLNGEVKVTNEKIDGVEADIKLTTEEVEALQSSIKALEKKIKERDEVLRERVRAMQLNGDTVSYLDVLLGANSFSDFIDRFSTVTTLVEADKSIMKQQADDQKQLEEEKILVEKKLTELEENKSELEKLKTSLESQKKEQARLVDELNIEQKKLNKEKESLETAFEETHEMTKELEAEIVSEQNRQLEAARKAAEAEKKRLEELAKVEEKAASTSQDTSSKQNGTSGGSNNTTTSPSISAPPVSSGTWTIPASGRHTSPFGMRKDPVTGKFSRMHYGADIANSSGTPIVAAADGVVFRAGGHSSYGNHVMITHSINGQVYTTVYAHLSSMNVGVGQVVKKGQKIGGMGATGRVTGVHLHFELYRGAYRYGSAINPVGIVF